MITMISLFGNFYFRTYRNARSKREGEHNKQNGDVQNGTVQNGSEKKIN
jgi:preprotein translocase subunit YajC